MNEVHRSGRAPDRNAEYLLYQTLVGAWPLDEGRVLAYMDKATREAKTYTSWTDPSEDYDRAVRNFVQGLFSSNEFLGDLELFVAPLIEPGWKTSLAQTLIKMTWPGIPDMYQGCELWDLSLVDPDNRMPVDYEIRAELLASLGSRPDAAAAWSRRSEGLPKMLVVKKALELRAERPHSFDPGARYEPVAASGLKSDHVVAFARGADVVVVTPRLVLRLGEEWKDTALQLPSGTWVDRFTERSVTGSPHVGEVLADFPVALLVRA